MQLVIPPRGVCLERLPEIRQPHGKAFLYQIGCRKELSQRLQSMHIAGAHTGMFTTNTVIDGVEVTGKSLSMPAVGSCHLQTICSSQWLRERPCGHKVLSGCLGVERQETFKLYYCLPGKPQTGVRTTKSSLHSQCPEVDHTTRPDLPLGLSLRDGREALVLP